MGPVFCYLIAAAMVDDLHGGPSAVCLQPSVLQVQDTDASHAQ
jgi:hypothetical protein